MTDENNLWPPCRIVGDTETTHRIHAVVEHQRFANALDPLLWWTACGLQMRSTRRRHRTDSDKEWHRADVLPPNRQVTCLECLAKET